MKKNRGQKVKKHNCDGKCYWSTGMCPEVETCEETRTKEFVCTGIAFLVVLLMPISIIALAIVLFIGIL